MSNTKANRGISSFFKNMFDKQGFKETFVLSGNNCYILAFIIPLILYSLLFIINNFSPFGDYVYMPSDMYHQYTPFYSELWYKLRNGQAFEFTWHVGLGSDFTSIYTYYLSSPINWIIALFPHSAIPVVLDAMIIFKCCLASLFFNIYITKHFNCKSSFAAILGCVYSMSGYYAAYSWNIMWLDCLAMAPLVFLGIEKLVNKNRGILFCISLALCVLFNYYISIMLVIASCVYFIVLLCTTDKSQIIPKSRMGYFLSTRIIKFLLFGILAAGLSCVLLIPQLQSFSLSASSEFSFPKKFELYFSVSQLLSRHMVNVNTYTYLDHFPNIFCSVMVFALIPLFFMNKEISVREKIRFGVITGFIGFSFMANITEYIWHGFHVPNCLPARQSFIYIFFLLVMCYMTFRHRHAITDVQLVISVAISYAFLAYTDFKYGADKSSFSDSEYTYSHWSVYISMIFLGIYFAYLFFDRIIYDKKSNLATEISTHDITEDLQTRVTFKLKKKKLKQLSILSTFILCATILVECAVNMGITGLSRVGYSNYLKYDETYAEIDNVIKTHNPDETFYRIEQTDPRTNNDGSWYSYNSMSLFSSTSVSAISNLYRSLGMKASMNAYNGLGATQFVYALTSVKYVVSPDKFLNDDPNCSLLYETQISASRSLYVYENKNVLPLGFTVPTSLAESNYTTTKNISGALDRQNEIFASATGISDLYEKTDEITDQTDATFTCKKSGRYYLICINPAPDEITVAVNGQSNIVYSDLESHNHVMDVGYLNEGDTVEFQSSDDAFSGYLYVSDSDKLTDGINILNSNAMTVNSISETEISGTVNISTDRALIFSTPYNPGWTVYIDGSPVESYSGLGALLCVNVVAGEHEVVLKYHTSGLFSGAGISLLSVGILSLIIFLSKKFRKINIDSNQATEELYK